MKKTDHERHMKECLEERRIRPTANLWESLERELDKKGKRRRYKKIYRLVGIAAILLGVFGGSLLLGPTSQNHISKVSKKTDAIDSTLHPQNPKAVQEVLKDVQFTVLPRFQEEELSKGRKAPKIQESVLVTSTPMQSRKKIPPQIVNPNKEEVAQTDENLWAVENLSHVEEEQEREQDSGAYTTIDKGQDETEVLLREALYQEFLADTKKERDSVRILALGEQLLKEINIDLKKEEDRAFRDKIWEVIQKGWERARSAVAVNPDTP